MILDERTYTLTPSRKAAFLKAYEARGLAVQLRFLERLIGYFETEIGTVNQIVHIWAYDDLKDRADRRAALQRDPEWQAFVAETIACFDRMENRILVPTSFSPMR